MTRSRLPRSIPAGKSGDNDAEGADADQLFEKQRRFMPYLMRNVNRRYSLLFHASRGVMLLFTAGRQACESRRRYRHLPIGRQDPIVTCTTG
jgi:hypothetical protein